MRLAHILPHELPKKIFGTHAVDANVYLMPANLSREIVGHDVIVLGEVGVVRAGRKELVGPCRRYAMVTRHSEHNELRV